MRGAPIHRRARATTRAVALLLFLTGSNYCLATVLSGGSMACLASPMSEPAACSHCNPHGTKPPAAPASSPCCVSIDQVSAPTVAKSEALSGLAAMVAAQNLMAPVQPAMLAAPRVDESPPASHEPPGASLGRAPPTS